MDYITWLRFVVLVSLCTTPCTTMPQKCPHGMYGEDCLSVCLCSWDGTISCTSDVGTCICKQGSTGKLCQNDVNECDNPEPPCNHANMYCSNTKGHYKCVCRDGYLMSPLGYCTPCLPYTHGRDCFDTCTCNLENTVYCEGGSCVCRPGWGGPTCSDSHDDCVGVICPEGTFCVDSHRSYNCLCASGFLLIAEECQEYETIAVAIEPSPGYGELVDVFVFYKLPEAYLYKAHSLPNFVYTVTIETNNQQLCDIDYLNSHFALKGDEKFLKHLKNIDTGQYQFYSHVKIIFTEAIFATVQLIPQSNEYYEMGLQFDVRPKSQAESDCLLGVRIPGTSKTQRLAPVYKRQSYLSFEVEFKQTSNCGETPRVEWSFYFINVSAEDHQESCLNAKYILKLDINDLIESAGEFIISDHKSPKEIIPKSTLPLGYTLVCVMAFVHRNRRLRASSCGYINVVKSNIIWGKIVPNNEDINWSEKYPLTLVADFIEPDANSTLFYHWKCKASALNARTYTDCTDHLRLFKHVDYTQRELVLSAGFCIPGRKLNFSVIVCLDKNCTVSETDRMTVWGEYKDKFIPMTLDCLQSCGDVIGAGKNVILKANFPFRIPRKKGICYRWDLEINGRAQGSSEIAKIVRATRFYVYDSWEGITETIHGSSLKPGVIYSLSLNAWVYTDHMCTRRGRSRPCPEIYKANTWYSFEVEPPPSGAGCSISPSQGEAVFTRFTVECFNFFDPVSKLPLTYRLYQVVTNTETNTQISTLIAYSASSVMDKITLSTRGDAGVYTVHLYVEVRNVKGTSNEIPISVQLTVLDQAQALKRLIGNIIIQSGGQEDARLLKDVATIIGVDSTAGFLDKVSVRQDVLSNVNKLDSDSKDNIEQVSHVLCVSVEKQDEIEPTGLGSGIETAARLSKYLGKVSNDNINLTKDVAQSQVNALSTLIYVASGIGETISNNDTNDTEAADMLHENMEQSLLATRSIANIADVLLNAITGVDENVKMVTEFMSMYVGWNSVNENTTFGVESDDAKFSLSALDTGVIENEIVEAEYEIFKKNPYGWTANNIHGNMPVIKVNLVRQQKKHLLKAETEKETFRFSKPADVFLNYNASGEDIYYPILIKVVKLHRRIDIIRRSSCVQMTVGVSTTHTTVLKITSPDNLKILVKAKYTNAVNYFEGMYDEEMVEMPFKIPEYANTSRGLLFRNGDLLILPKLTKQQIKRNNPYYRVRLSISLNQMVDTTLLQRVEIDTNKTVGADEEPGEYYNVTIQATPHKMACLHFDEEKKDYLSDECTVSMYSDLDLMHCRCIVAAAYTGSVLVVPRLINPFDISLFAEVFKNPLVVSMVVALWLIYFALISWGRSRDKYDETKTSVTVLDDNREEHNYVYLICVVTGWSSSSATSSNVFISLKGSWFQSDNHVLQDPTRHLFRSGEANWFMLTTDGDIGDLKAVVIWTDFSGAYPSWFLSSVYVQNMQTSETWMCPFNNWIGVRPGIDRLQAEIPAVQEKTYASKWSVKIMEKGQNDIRNEHLWFGIVAKTPYNKFTRVRRLTTGLSILQSLMLLNHMFFGIRDKDDPGQFIEVLDQRIHVTSVIIGIQTAVIIFFLGIGISMLFNRVSPYPKITIESMKKYEQVLDFLERMHRKAEVTEDSDSDSEDSDSQEGESDSSEQSSGRVSLDDIDSNRSARALNVNTSAERRRGSSVDPVSTRRKSRGVKKRSLTKQKVYVLQAAAQLPDATPGNRPAETPGSTYFMLPWWFIYVTWTFLVIYNVFLSYYIMLYGLSLGYEKSVDWALAFFTGFLTNVFLIQPIKVVFMVFILVLVFKQGHTLKEQAPVAKLNDGIQLVQERKKYNRKFKTMLPKVLCRVPLNTTEAKTVLERLAIESDAREMLRDLVLYTIFMVSVLIVAFGHMDVRSQFLQTQYFKHKFLKTPIFPEEDGEGYESLGKLDKVKGVEDMWKYINTIVAPELLKDKSSISVEHDIYLMGTARLRQVRSTDDADSCTNLPGVMRELFMEKACSFSSFYVSEETNTYDNTWRVVSNISKDIIDDSPYVYRTSKELNGAVIIGQHGVYSGGGYIVPFGQDDLRAMEDTLTKLYNSDWIDELTKCVFVEFTLYNAASDHFTNVIIAFEFSNYGAIYPSALINSAMIFNKELNDNVWLQISEGVLVICTLFYAVVEIQRFRKLSFKTYFSSVWSCLEVLTIILICAVGISFFLRYYEFVEILKDVQKYGQHHFFNFEAVFQMHEHLHIYLAMLGGVVIFKMLKVTAFNPLVVVTHRTFINAQDNFYGLMLIVIILFLALAVTGILFFGKVLRSYRSLSISLFTLIFFIMGESEYESLVDADLILGRVYFLIVTTVSQYLVVNFFCSILQEGFELTRYMAFRREQETIKYMMDRMKFYSGFGPGNVRTKKQHKI